METKNRIANLLKRTIDSHSCYVKFMLWKQEMRKIEYILSGFRKWFDLLEYIRSSSLSRRIMVHLLYNEER